MHKNMDQRHMLALFLLASCSSMCLAEIFGISDHSYPHVLITDPIQAPVVWHKKAFGFRLLNSAAVRINARGIWFIPSSHTMLTGMLDNSDEAIPMEVHAQKLVMKDVMGGGGVHLSDLKRKRDAADASKWRYIHCSWARDSLCHLLGNSQTRFLPNFPGQVYVSQSEEQAPLELFWMMKACPETATARFLAPQRHGGDISLCNIVGVGADYVYIPSKKMLYVLLDPLNNVSLVFMSIFIIYLMIIMGHNLQVVLGASAPEKKAKGQWTGLCLLALVGVTCLSSSSVHTCISIYVTWEDRIVFFALLAHILYYCARIEIGAWVQNGKRANPVNPMLAGIYLAVQRVYGSVENPYSEVLFFVMLTWALHKVSMLCYRSRQRPNNTLYTKERVWRSLDCIMDGILLSLLLYAGAVGQMQMESTTASAALLQGMLAAMTLNKALSPLHFASIREA
jgi:hypothetical protein